MIIEQEIEAAFDVHNVVELCSDLESNLMSTLAHEFEGKCYAGLHILKVLRLKNYSDLEVNLQFHEYLFEDY